MNELLEVLLLLVYFIPVFLAMFIGTGEYLQAWDIEERQYFARIILVAPFWPVALVWWIVRYAPELIGRTVGNLFVDATRRIDG